jgi:GNAT superfamily N-acetyltransferase
MNISSADPAATEGYAHLSLPPPACWTADEHGAVRARVAMTEAPPDIASAPGARMLVGLWWEPGRADAARAVIRAAVGSLAPGEVLDLRHHAEVHPHIPDRLTIAADCGFTLFQEKQGYWWTDDIRPLPAPAHLTFRTLADVGPDHYSRVLAAAVSGTLDRQLGAQGGDTAPLMAWYDPTADRDSWLLAEDPGGHPVGCLALSAFDEPGVGTITNIAVLPAHRGHGHIHDLLRAAHLAARHRGFHALLSDVDIDNHPMRNAFLHAGHRTDARPWHVWHHTLTAG